MRERFLSLFALSVFAVSPLLDAARVNAGLRPGNYEKAKVESFDTFRVEVRTAKGTKYNLSRVFFKSVEDLRPGLWVTLDEKMIEDDLRYRTDKARYSIPKGKASR